MVWNELFKRAKEIAAEWNTDPRTPRLTANQQNRDNVPANTPKQYWRRALYLPLVAHLIQELNRAISHPHKARLAQSRYNIQDLLHLRQRRERGSFLMAKL